MNNNRCIEPKPGKPPRQQARKFIDMNEINRAPAPLRMTKRNNGRWYERKFARQDQPANSAIIAIAGVIKSTQVPRLDHVAEFAKKPGRASTRRNKSRLYRALLECPDNLNKAARRAAERPRHVQ